eukprot:169895-Chlamydomonas_euryale.AAC.6
MHACVCACAHTHTHTHAHTHTGASSFRLSGRALGTRRRGGGGAMPPTLGTAGLADAAALARGRGGRSRVGKER